MKYGAGAGETGKSVPNERETLRALGLTKDNACWMAQLSPYFPHCFYLYGSTAFTCIVYGFPSPSVRVSRMCSRFMPPLTSPAFVLPAAGCLF